MKKIGVKGAIILLLFQVLVIAVHTVGVQAAENTYTVRIQLPDETIITLEMQKTDYIGTIKFKLQNQVDFDINKMDLIYEGKILSEVKRFSSGIVPANAIITLQPSKLWNYDEVKGVDDITFSIARPKEDNLKRIYAKDYGMSPDNEDNTKAFINALKDSSANAHLVIEQGIYHFRNMENDIEINNFENVIIDGNGSTFIFDTKYCMKIYGGNGVEIRNLKVDWDWEKIPVGSLVQLVKKHSRNVFDIQFIGVDEVDENIPIGTFMYLDPETLTVGSYGTYKAYTPGSVEGCLQKVEKVGSNVLRITHNGDMRHFNEGEYYLLRHFEYSGRVFSTVNYAKNITYDNVSIYGFTGMGWVFSSNANHFQIINSYLGLDPDGPKERRIATAADAIHILNTGGYFRIADSDFGFTGDDIINIHDDVMDILSIDESRTRITGWATSGFMNPGETIGLKNSQQAQFTDYEAKVVSYKTINGYEREIVLEEPLPANITEDCFIYSTSHSSSKYVISNNYIHEARARAALLNDDYGLFENNYVYRMLSGAVEVCSSYSPGRWFEGEGACHVVVSNNKFEECNFGSGQPVVKVGVKIADYDSTEQILNDIRIENNTFLNCIHNEDKGIGLMVINNADNVVITGNMVINSGEIIIKETVGKVTIKNNAPHIFSADRNGLIYDSSDGNWYYVKDGRQVTSYTGLVYHSGDWWYVTNGKLDKKYKGITEYNGKTYFVKDGKWTKSSGIWHQDGNVYWIVNGVVDSSVYDLKYDAGTWYYYRAGKVDWTYNTLAYANNQWWYVNNGVLDKSYTGLVLFRNQLWYVTEGKLDKAYVGTTIYEGKLYNVKNGIGTE